MMRIQLHLTDDQDQRLRALARKRGITRAELIRRGIDRVLEEERSGRDSLLDLVGAAGEGPRRDLSEHHDEVLYRIPLEPEHLLRAAEPPPKLQ